MIVAISDTHCQHDQVQVPECNILIHAGDATYHGTVEELLPFVNWLSAQPAQHKIFVPGNHDLICQRDPGLVHNLFRAHGIRYLVDELVVLDGLRIYGSPWIPNLRSWAFYAPDSDLERIFGNVPEDLDILITHGPAFGTSDALEHQPSMHVGSEALREAILRTSPKVHISGHIHEGYGELTLGQTRCYNVSICTRQYDPTNAPTVITL